jgi:hypothetical protein
MSRFLFLNRGFGLPVRTTAEVTPPKKKLRLRSTQIAASFDYGREMMKQAFLFMSPVSAPGAFTSQQAPSERSFITLGYIPSFSR